MPVISNVFSLSLETIADAVLRGVALVEMSIVFDPAPFTNTPLLSVIYKVSLPTVAAGSVPVGTSIFVKESTELAIIPAKSASISSARA